MADEVEITEEAVPATPATPPAAEMASEEFDWGEFFTDKEEPAPVVATPGVAEIVVDDSEDDLRAQLAKAQGDASRALEIAQAAQTQGKMSAAIEAWKAQASPAEIELSDILLGSSSPEELQKNAMIVKTAAAKLDATVTERVAQDRKDLERQMQSEFGMPIQPTFQPMPEAEKVKQLLKEGELEDAAATMMKGF